MEDPAAVLRASAPPASAAEATARAPAMGAVAPPPAPAAPTAAGADGGGRQIFSVELRPGETTIVSWKKLLKEAGVAAALPPSLPAAAAVQPVVEPLAGLSAAAPPTENDPNDPSQSNRFNAVIEKIERLYMGKHSSDEEDLDDVPDDDQYDTEDSFIDDAELDEYFEVDNLATKHTGYFVNKGKLEQSEYGSVQNAVADGSVQNVGPKKRRRREPSSSYIENNREFAAGSIPVKDPKRNALETGKNLASSDISSYSEYQSEGNKPVKNKSTSPGRMQKMKSSDHAIGAEHASYLNISTDGYHYPAYSDKDAPVRLDLQSEKTFNGPKQDLSKKMRRKEKYGVSQFSGLSTANNAYSTQTTQLSANRRIEGSGIKAKGTRLERAIRDLQNIVSEYRPQTLDIQDIDPNCQAAVKRRLPQEVKQKLAKVARLSANQGKIPEEELVNRLMGIVGHLVQRRTLKRNMKEMVESGIYAKQEKADKFRQVKVEICEMIKTRLATGPKVTEPKDDSADDFQGAVDIDERRALKGKFVLDAPLEDRICDLYDLYVEGMDEDKGPQSRKLYVELADLWPQGYMDKVEIRNAISRSKERRNLLYRQRKARNEERMKRRRLAAASKLRDGNPVVPQYTVAQQAVQVPMKSTQLSMSRPHIEYPSVSYGGNQASRNADKVGETGVGAASDGNRSSSTDIKKRKLGSDTGDLRADPSKAPLRHGSEKQKPAKRADEAKVSSSLPQTIAAVVGYDPQRPGYS
ncbi:ubinuclein-1 isoform X2 [Brachypodium distachyon]|uniref:ubinuclein-1 isoform X2 n=1 Tax=Brachypodium distachyon TaxID=15368 RepID=UPI0001D43377|nr:ubinuclein-1 isoform X2 [Brachypodium distachyon]|eukprot:XP_010231358.1 ubinuclein-1 isoform X2 [Brachypodium distachyon]